MVVDRVVQPVGRLGVLLARRNERRIGPVRPRQLAEVLALEAGVDRRPRRPALPRVGVVGDASIGTTAVRALAILDHIGRVVHDDVHIDLQAPRVGRVDQGLEVGLGPEVRIDIGEVGDPVAVMRRRLLSRRALHRLVREDRRQPDRRRAQAPDVVQPAGRALQVAAVIEAGARRIEAVDQRPPVRAAMVIGRVAVLEAVGQQEIDHLVLRLALQVGRRRGEGRSGQGAQAQGGQQRASPRRHDRHRSLPAPGSAPDRHCNSLQEFAGTGQPCQSGLSDQFAAIFHQSTPR